MLMMDESPDMDDEGSESGDRVIYPWMKKIHVAGVGECFLFFNFKKNGEKWRKGKKNFKSRLQTGQVQWEVVD